MLVLSRYEGESLLLLTSDGQVEISVELIEGHRAKIGIDAPKAAKVVR